MRAIGFSAPGGPEVLTDLDLPEPEPGPRDLLVAVEAISVNPVDTKVRQRPLASAPGVLGYDAAGTVVAVGSEVTLFGVGDRVWYAGVNNRPGSNAERQLVDERIAGRAPRSLNDTEAAALPLTAITAWELLFDRLGVTAESTGTILITGAAGGVGSILVQLAATQTSLRVIGTASRPETRAWVEELGAGLVVDHHDLAGSLAAAGIDQVEYVAALTATDRHLSTYAEIVAPQGKIAVIDDPGVLDISPFKPKSITVAWEFMFTRALYQTDDMIEQHEILDRIAALVDEGVLRTTYRHDGGVITAANLRAAHELQESGTAIGKTVLTGWPS